MALIFVDCEAYGGAPAIGQLTEFGAVEFKTREVYHGVIVPSRPSVENPAIPAPLESYDPERASRVMTGFASWLKSFGSGRHIMVSDNPAFDFQWINYEFLLHPPHVNPFGHSARRIADFYAGLVGNFYETQKWKRLRVTNHDHNPVNDAMGNVEAFARMLAGER